MNLAINFFLSIKIFLRVIPTSGFAAGSSRLAG
jgi:hypothetical protein